MSRIRFPIDDGSSYALPHPQLNGKEDSLSWRLQYGHIDKKDRRICASIIASYEYLLCETDQRAAEVRRAYRKYHKEHTND